MQENLKSFLSKNKKLKITLFSFLAFILSATTSYAITTYLYSPAAQPISPTQTPPAGGKLNIDPSAPRTEACPLNGKYYTKTEKAVWEQRRPLFVMIENHVESRPQSGINQADIIYEAVAEGGITRFGALFYCDIAAKDTVLGPVRSARTHFLDWASEYNKPLYVHVGGANCSPTDPNNAAATCQTDPRAQSLEQINEFGWGGSSGNDLNQFSIGYPTFWRDYERLGRTVATEHTMYTSTEKLFSYAKEDRGWTNLSPSGNEWKEDFNSWAFKDEAEPSPRGSIDKISFNFWNNPNFKVDWSYNSDTNLYLRSTGGELHKDLNTDQQLDAKVVVVQFTQEIGPVDPLKHILYSTQDGADALIFQDGKVIEGSWSKRDKTARTIFTNEKGEEIKFNRGKIFIEIVPKGNDVQY